MKQRFFLMPMLVMLGLIGAIGAYAAIPAGYYSTLKGKSESDLKTALFQIINPHTLVSSYQNLPQYFQKTDVYPNSSRWWDMYSDIPLYAPSFSGLNREHSLPKSWWGGLTNIPAYTDLNHLYPSEAAANQAKSNYPLGKVVGTKRFDNGMSVVGVGENSGGAAYVFEPADEYKGDFARTYFYMVTCYQNMDWKYTYMCRNGVYPSLQQWAIDLLLEWHRGDPVSQKEQDRNEQVFLVQNNRNPFIDHPDLVEYIWGNKKGQAYVPADTPVPGGEANLITPPNGMTLDFSQTAAGLTSTAQLQFKGENLVGSLELSIGGADRACFSLSTDNVGANAANATSGTWITVTYSPKSVGVHTANLIITDGGLDEGSRIVSMRGECLPAPSLSRVNATSATDITDDTYTANWDVPADETIDFYIVTIHRYSNSGVTVEEQVAENNSLEITGFANDTYDTYSVRSSRLGITSEESNVITVNHNAAIDYVNTELPFAVETYPGGLVRFRCSETAEDVRIFDMTGRLTTHIDHVTDLQEITLPTGVYAVTARNSRVPVRIIVY
ncbi:MAG: endonuclease [Paramuribaculum sp.]|nr:endonuclease [Paramuribaculum sp.]MDE6324400.1 endonuclease [Paramuribaculum sp.]MDE6488600.1 endonuclease [Paramuribaculum sp.]